MEDDSVSRNGHVCCICERSFTRKQNMLLHRVTHSDIKTFECSLCTYKCHRKDQLEDHRLVHARQKRRLDCPVLLCGFVASAAYKLRSHLMKKHKIAPGNPAICGHCNIKFRSCHSLMVHYHTRDLFPDEHASGFSQESGSINSHVREMPINLDDRTLSPQIVLEYLGKCGNLDLFKAWSESFAQLNSESIAHLQAKLVDSGIFDLEAFSNFPATTSYSKPQSQIESIMAEHSYCLPCPRAPQSQFESIMAEHSYCSPYPRDSPDVVVNVSNVSSDGSERPLNVASPASASYCVEKREESVDSDCPEHPLMIASSSDQMETREDSPHGCTSTQSDDTFPVGASAHSPIRCEIKDKKKLECPLCKITYQDEALYLIHMGFHSRGDPYRCNMCGIKYVSRIEFNGHLMFENHRVRARSCP